MRRGPSATSTRCRSTRRTAAITRFGRSSRRPRCSMAWRGAAGTCVAARAFPECTGSTRRPVATTCPLLEGDEIHATKELVRARAHARPPRRRQDVAAPRVQLLQPARRARGALGDVRDPHRARGRRSGASTRRSRRPRYTAGRDRAIDDELADEVRGHVPRYWEDVEIGEAVDPVVSGPLTVADMVAWMMGIGSPHVRSGQYWLHIASNHRRSRSSIRTPGSRKRSSACTGTTSWPPRSACRPPTTTDPSAAARPPTSSRTGPATTVGWPSSTCQFRGMFFIGDRFWIKRQVIDQWRGAKTGTGYVSASSTASTTAATTSCRARHRRAAVEGRNRPASFLRPRCGRPGVETAMNIPSASTQSRRSMAFACSISRTPLRGRSRRCSWPTSAPRS